VLDMTEKLKAEAYVRSQRPALMELTFGCEVKARDWVDKRKKINGYFVRYLLSRSVEYIDCVFPKKNEDVMATLKKEEIEIIGHPIQLNDWLAVLGHWYWVDGIGDVWKTQGVGSNTLRLKWKFNLATGQPATEADYKYFNKIVGV